MSKKKLGKTERDPYFPCYYIDVRNDIMLLCIDIFKC